MRLGKYNVPRKDTPMRTQKLPPPPAPELSGRQITGRAILFFAGCMAMFRGAIWLGDVYVP